MKILNVIGLVSIALALFSCEDNYDMTIDRIGTHGLQLEVHI